MTSPVDTRITATPPRSSANLFRLICTSNPFYVLSAALFLVGLRISFGSPESLNAWALLSGLVGYTLLMAVTACLLVRFGNVWDDVRTVLLLVVLLFLATSVTFDEVLVFQPALGFLCYGCGLVFAIAVSEGVLRATRLQLPALFRLPYYLLLALFFLYPLALSPLVEAQGEELTWGLFAFSGVAGLVFLSLLPAIRRGEAYTANNGSPWRWPLYPWVLFGVFALSVPARAILLCFSMQHLTGSASDSVIFGPYFVVPFGFALAILLLEIGIVSQKTGALITAWVAPWVLFIIALIGHRNDSVYLDFLSLFSHRVGADPAYLTLSGVVAYFAYAVLRRVPFALTGLTMAVLLLAFVPPNVLERGELSNGQPLPFLLVGLIQLGWGLWQRKSWNCLLGGVGLALAGALWLPGALGVDHLREAVLLHLLLLVAMVISMLFDDTFACFLRGTCALMVLLFCLGAMFTSIDPPPSVALGPVMVYPLAMALILLGYGWWLRHRMSWVIVGLIGVCWLGVCGVRGYIFLRVVVPGLDLIAVSLSFFAVAVLISLGKAGLFARWLGQQNEGTKEPPLEMIQQEPSSSVS